MTKPAKIRAVNIVASGSLRRHDATIATHLKVLFPKFMEAQTQPIKYFKRNRKNLDLLDMAVDWDYHQKDPDLMLFNYHEALQVNDILYAVTIVRRPLILVDVPNQEDHPDATWDYSLVHRKLFRKGHSGMLTLCVTKNGEVDNDGELKLVKLRKGSDKKMPSGLDLAAKEKFIYR
ncbi:MAG: hypothetical protein EON60_11920 [Alphaproteobacteria bacterium]|nr:MAG: hypothetical protein EON60_11920 [Alphaproteobacteria bacterium]